MGFPLNGPGSGGEGGGTVLVAAGKGRVGQWKEGRVGRLTWRLVALGKKITNRGRKKIAVVSADLFCYNLPRITA